MTLFRRTRAQASEGLKFLAQCLWGQRRNRKRVKPRRPRLRGVRLGVIRAVGRLGLGLAIAALLTLFLSIAPHPFHSLAQDSTPTSSPSPASSAPSPVPSPAPATPPPTVLPEATPPLPLAPRDLSKAYVELRGRRLFQVTGVPGISAEQRAAEISRKLEDSVSLDSPPQVELRSKEGSSTLWLIGPGMEPNGTQPQRLSLTERYLMTVTTDDAGTIPPQEQARNWSSTIATALESVRKELTRSAQESFVVTLGILGIALGLQWLMVRAWQWVRSHLEHLIAPSLGQDEEEGDPPSQLLELLLKLVLLIFLVLLWATALFNVADLFSVTRELSNQFRDRLADLLLNPLIPLGDERYSLFSLVLLGLGLMAVIIASGVVTDFLRARFLNALGIGMGIQEAIAVVFKYSFITISVIVLLQVWGLDLSSLAILASAFGVGIGFGFQDIAKNLGSGLVLVFERPIQVGDFVEVGGYTGTIEKLGARSTRIRTLDDLTVFVPNSRFLEEEVTNWSSQRKPTRIRIPVGVAYGSDLELVKNALLEAAHEQKGISKAPKPQVLFTGFGDSSLDFVLFVWVPRPQLHVRIKSDLNFKIDAAFRQHNIEIPFPQRDLNLRSGQLPMLLDAGKTDSGSGSGSDTENDREP